MLLASSPFNGSGALPVRRAQRAPLVVHAAKKGGKEKKGGSHKKGGGALADLLKKKAEGPGAAAGAELLATPAQVSVMPSGGGSRSLGTRFVGTPGMPLVVLHPSTSGVPNQPHWEVTWQLDPSACEAELT